MEQLLSIPGNNLNPNKLICKNDSNNFSLMGTNALNDKIKKDKFLVKKDLYTKKTIINLKYNVSIGDNKITVIAGPCSIESLEQMVETAISVKESGATILRGGAYKPRSSPYSFQGKGETGLKILKEAGEKVNLPIITEVLDSEDIEIVSQYADILQVGARNSQNFSLLKKLGKINKPILLKRGMMNTIEEFLCAAEYILSGGNPNVILCERGIRTFERETRFTLDISAVPILKEKTHLPIIVDPSHAAGNWQLIEPLSYAAIAAGADGLMIEVHHDPANALCDGEQSLKPAKFKRLLVKLKEIAIVMGREM
jgi:3-deoxy-7-phosphoheptulonate synthase